MLIGYGRSTRTARKEVAPGPLSPLKGAKRVVGPRAWLLMGGLCLFLFGPALPAKASDNSPPSPSPVTVSSATEGATALLRKEPQPAASPHHKRADFGREQRSLLARRVADWVVDSGDNAGMPFAIIDKKDARVFVFNPDGKLRGAAPVLVGLAPGDDSTPGIGDRKLSDIRPEERTTPAGRFVASLGTNYSGKDVLWVDYDLAISMHRVVTSNPAERRLERLATATPSDNRISYGCINVPVEFYNKVVSPTFTGTYGIVYILPEIQSHREVFASYYDVD